jgi:hypothetical protein
VSIFNVGRHIPDDRPLFSLLLGTAVDALAETAPDVVLGWYLEPFGLAASVAAAMTDTPCVLCTAASDVVRLAATRPLASAYRQAGDAAVAVLTKRSSLAHARAVFGDSGRIILLGSDPLPPLVFGN